ncbi:MAG: TetR/AcrR family transcriptional regulator [Pseudomonadota bacterium]|jgi:TetR/AcrR family transcriptional repressor of mexJK operon
MESEAVNPQGRRGRPTPKSAEARNQRIEAVAREAFTRQGYARASVDDIARRAGVAKRTIYSLYGGKAGLFEKLIGQTASPLPDAQAFEHLESAAEVLVAAALALFIGETAELGLKVLRVVIAEAATQSELVGQVQMNGRQRVIGQYAEVFARLFARELLKPAMGPARAAELFIDAVVGGAMMLRLSGADQDIKAKLENLVDLFVAGYSHWAAKDRR